MVVEVPERSKSQRLEALDKANYVRTKRSKLKRELKAGRVNVGKLILEPPSYIHTMKLWDLMMAMPSHGRVKVNKILTQHRISPSKTVGGLSLRQREEVVRHLRRK